MNKNQLWLTAAIFASTYGSGMYSLSDYNGTTSSNGGLNLPGLLPDTGGGWALLVTGAALLAVAAGWLVRTRQKRKARMAAQILS